MTSRSDPASGRPVLVVGGRGFIGAHVTAELIATGYRPHVFGPAMPDDLLADLAGRFDETEGSVEDRSALAAAIRESGAGAMVTTAAFSSGRVGLMRSGDDDSDRALGVNVLGFRNAAEAALQEGVRRLVWTDSTVVYGPAADYPDEPVDEDAPTAPHTFYGLTKDLSERLAGYYARRHGLEVVGLRLPLVLGPKLWYRGAASEILRLVEAAQRGAPHRIAFHGDPMDLMHAADVARALRAALAHDSPLATCYNINGFRAAIPDVAAALSRRFPGWQAEIETVPPALTFPAISDARFRRDLGFRPRFGLDDTIDSLLREARADD